MATAFRQGAVPAQRFTFPAGTLEVTVESQSMPLDRLCDFAARNNAKRGFLIVSRVLGRHMPTAPSEMQASFDALAEQILCLEGELPAPVVFVGMAETAICLGQGVHAAYRRLSGRTDTLYIHTTRQELDATVMAGFDEPHSHASSHLLYYPGSEKDEELLATARSLVLVDDETSTGTTFVNLAKAMAANMPQLDNITTVVLTDWSDHGYLGKMPAPTSAVNLLKGSLSWAANPGFEAPASAVAERPRALGKLFSTENFGRLGIQGDPAGVDALADNVHLECADYDRLLVLGTGEFTYLPFLLAKALEDRGHQVEVQSTTRSPVHVGGAIKCAMTFNDNYGTPVPNFLYNVEHDEDRKVIICHETPKFSIDPRLVDQLDAACLYLGDGA
jgi:hypothetical protein